MRYAQIRKIDISDGPGIRVSLYTQGCAIHCKNCYNSDIWDYEGGKEWNNEVKEMFLSLCDKKQVAGISILGGEPLSACNLDALKDLFETFRTRFPEKNIWMWTGYVYESLDEKQKEVASLVDVLVDGPFIDEQKDIRLKYRGSANQRVLKKEDRKALDAESEKEEG